MNKMKYDTIFEIRIHYKNTNPTTIITLNDYTITLDIAYKIMMRHLENVENKDQIQDAHIVQYALIPKNVRVYTGEGNIITVGDFYN